MTLDTHKPDMMRLCAQNKVKTLHAFGSVLTDRFGNNSDIDLLVDIDVQDPFEYTDCYFNLKFALQDLFDRPIDLLESKAIRNDYLRREIDNTKELVYAG